MKHLNETYVVDYGRTRIPIGVRMSSTERYRQHLMPPAVRMHIDPHSDLGQALAPSLQLTTQWNELLYTCTQMSTMAISASQFAFLMPWARDVMVESRWRERPETFAEHFISGKANKLDIKQATRDIEHIVEARTPDEFPRLTRRVNDVCMSGNHLLTHYRLLRDIDGKAAEMPAIRIMRGEMQPDQTLVDEMIAIRTAWLKANPPDGKSWGKELLTSRKLSLRVAGASGSGVAPAVNSGESNAKSVRRCRKLLR